MRLHKPLLASLALAAAIVAVGAIAAFASSPLKITNCNQASSRPKSVTLTCGDGNTVLVGGAFDNANAGAAWVFTFSNGALRVPDRPGLGVGQRRDGNRRGR